MAALNDDVKVFIITALACFDSPKQVIADVKERFGLVVTYQQLQAYDTKHDAGKRMSKRFQKIFEDTRAKFLKDVSDIPIAQQSYRLRVLDRLARKAEERGNVVVVASLMEQAAKESGGSYTNKVNLGGVVGNMNLPPPAPSKATQTSEDAYRLMLGGVK